MQTCSRASKVYVIRGLQSMTVARLHCEGSHDPYSLPGAVGANSSSFFARGRLHRTCTFYRLTFRDTPDFICDPPSRTA